jgi:hypothetical protein
MIGPCSHVAACRPLPSPPPVLAGILSQVEKPATWRRSQLETADLIPKSSATFNITEYQVRRGGGTNDDIWLFLKDLLPL